MLKRVLVLFTIATFFSCKSDTPQNETGENTVTTEALPADQSVPTADRSTITYEDGTTVDAKSVYNNSTSPVTADPSAPSSNGQATTSTTTAAQKNAAQKPSTEMTVKYGNQTKSETRYSIDPDEPDPLKVADLPIPNPCDLVSEPFLKNALALPTNPTKKAGKQGVQKYEKSCFWRFEDSAKPNAGMMLQVMVNPYSNDIDDFPSTLINSKMKDGEVDPYSKKAIKFQPWNDVSQGGCYSYEAGKYHWKVGKKYVFMLAFNASHSEAVQKQMAASIGKEILKNYKF